MNIISVDLSGNNASKLDPRQTFAAEVQWGLDQPKRVFPQEYTYDEKGSEIFEKIMQSTDYYICSCEQNMMAANKQAIIETMPSEFNIVDMGAGSGIKTFQLVEEALRVSKTVRYVPVDISAKSNELLKRNFKDLFPNVKSVIISGVFEEGLKYIKDNITGQSLYLFLGATIGNFDRLQSERFLMEMCKMMKPNDHVLLFIDLIKDFEVILKAYHNEFDTEFELNILERVNRELDANFDLKTFYSHKSFDVNEKCVKHYLVSRLEQDVNIKSFGKSFHFQEGDAILVQESHKYTVKEFTNLGRKCGFEPVTNYFDDKKYVMGALWRKSA